VNDLNLKVRAGEIVGLAGLLGAGRTETLESLFDLPKWRRQGEMIWRGESTQKRPTGLALVPEDRRHQGLHTAMTVRFNHSLASLPRFTALGGLGIFGGFMRESLERKSVEASMSRLHVKAAHSEVETATLSGGNQQKVALGKWLTTEPKVLLLDDPTRGVDVGAKSEIYRLMAEWAAQGLGILMASSENEEVLHLCHRIYVLRQGRCVGEFARGELTREALVHLCAAPLEKT
jgi:rhamnose transport system ATP-binding protein